MGFNVSGGGGGEPNVTYQIQNALTLALGLTPNIIGNAVSTVVLTANTVVMYPFILGMDYLATKIAVQVTAPGVGNAYLGVYELDEDFNPIAGAPIISSTALSVSTGGVKTAILGAPVQLLKNKKYGLAILSSVNVTLRSFTCLNWYGSDVTIPYGIAIQSIAGGFSSLPNNFVPSIISAADKQVSVTLFRN